MRVESCFSVLPYSFDGHMLTNLSSVLSNTQHFHLAIYVCCMTFSPSSDARCTLGGSESYFNVLSYSLFSPLFLQSRFTGPGNPGALRALSYYLILFPSLDTLSAFPLVLQASTNNIYCLLTGRDTSEEVKPRYDWLLLLLLRVSFAVISVLAAFGIANLVQVLKYAGLIGFCVLLFPAFLQFQSIRVCKKLFVSVVATRKESFPMSKVTPEQGGSSDDAKGKSSRTESGTEAAPLLSVQDQAAQKESSLYMTPYSNRILSHPIAVVVIGIIMVLLTLLAVISIFVHPQKLTCTPTQWWHC